MKKTLLVGLLSASLMASTLVINTAAHARELLDKVAVIVDKGVEIE